MDYNTAYGTLSIKNEVTPKRVSAVLKALEWCAQLTRNSMWQVNFHEDEQSLVQVINCQKIELFPLKAAYLDLGMKTQYSVNHLPINLNDVNACVRSNRYTHPRPLHTDMIASMILLLATENFDPLQVPATLHDILTPEQLELIPPRPANLPHGQIGFGLDTQPLDMGDQEARAFIEQEPENLRLHHAKRLLEYRHPQTLRWILFEFLDEPLVHADSRWAIEQLYNCLGLFTNLEQYFYHPNSMVRCWAVSNFVNDESEGILELLLPMRYDGDSKVVHQVFTRIRQLPLSLSEMNDIISPLLENQHHQNVAIVHLGHLEMSDESKLELLGPYLSSPTPDTVVATIRALRNSDDEQTEKALIDCLDTENEQITKCLLQSITQFGAWFEPYVKSYIGKKRLYQSLLIALEKTSGFSRTPYICDLLKDQRNTILVRGIATLSRIGTEISLRAVGQYLLAHESRYVRRNAAEYLGESGLSFALPFLELAQEDESHGVRQSALRSIVQINAANSIPW